eukprot:2535038-Amphidinium_carterae.3
MPVALSAKNQLSFQTHKVRSSRRNFSTKDTSRIPLDSVISFIPSEELLSTTPPTADKRRCRMGPRPLPLFRAVDHALASKGHSKTCI